MRRIAVGEVVIRLSKHTLVLDLAGAALCLIALVVGAWFSFGRSNASGAQISVLRQDVGRLRSDVEGLQNTKTQMERDYSELLASAKTEGRLLEASSIESNLKHLTELIEDAGLMLTQVAPAGSDLSRNALRNRYVLTGAGRFPDMVRFFRSFEQSAFWADISHVKIVQSSPADDAEMGDIDLAVSFYSMVDDQGAPAS